MEILLRWKELADVILDKYEEGLQEPHKLFRNEPERMMVVHVVGLCLCVLAYLVDRVFQRDRELRRLPPLPESVTRHMLRYYDGDVHSIRRMLRDKLGLWGTSLSHEVLYHFFWLFTSQIVAFRR